MGRSTARTGVVSARRSLEIALDPGHLDRASPLRPDRPDRMDRGPALMDPAQLANEACKRFAALHTSALQASTVQASARPAPAFPAVGTKPATDNRDPRDPGAEPLLE